MGRILTISRVTVTADREEEYVRLIHQLSDLGGTRGQQLWLFRDPDSVGQFIEFSESRTPLSHRARASRTDLEVKLEKRLKEIVRYAPDAWQLWEEVPAPEPSGSEQDAPDD
jgi:predicted NAD/FAD-dependent oxidoreductase